MAKTKRTVLREFFDEKGVVWGEPKTYRKVPYARWRAGCDLLEKVPRNSRTPWERQFLDVALLMVLNKETAHARKRLDMPPIEVLSDADVARLERRMPPQRTERESPEELRLRELFDIVDLKSPETWTRVPYDLWWRMRARLHIKKMNAPLRDSSPIVSAEWRSEPMGASLTDWEKEFLATSDWIEIADAALRKAIAGQFSPASPTETALALLALWIAGYEATLNPIADLSQRINQATDAAARKRLEADRERLLRKTFAPSRKGKRGSLIPDEVRLLRMFDFCRSGVVHVVTAHLAGAPPKADLATCEVLVQGIASMGIAVRATAASIHAWRRWRRVSSVNQLPSDRIVSSLTYSLMAHLLGASSATVQDRLQDARRRWPKMPPRSAAGANDVDPAFARWLLGLQRHLDQETPGG